MDQALALEILLAGEHVLLTGPAGSGKTHLLNRFIKAAKGSGKHVAVTATTGLAATHLGGATIHSWSGIGIHNQLPSDWHDNLPAGRRDIILKTDVLVIDEVSMLHDYRLDMVDQAARRVRGNDQPFGGIQVVLCGDFFQLPPVNRADQPAGSFVVSAKVWQALRPIICYLDEQHRQNDPALLEVLTALRTGDVRRRHAETLLSRQFAELTGSFSELHTTNVDVDAINAEKLAALSGQAHSYAMAVTGRAGYVESLKRSCLAADQLVLKEGAWVMCIKNNPEKRYVNGSLGEVIGFDKDSDYPRVRLKNGRELVITPETWELRDGDKKRAGLTQLPLRLAWAITVHKSQGMTLDAARINLQRAFVEGMGYVALSRVRSLDNLSLSGLNRMALKVSPLALQIDKSLRQKSAADAQRFEHLRAAAAKRKLAPAKPASGWGQKLDLMRQKYPNAYKPWSPADDSRLVQLFSTGQGITLGELTKRFGRHPGSIRARLKKHFGEDAVVTVKKT